MPKPTALPGTASAGPCGSGRPQTQGRGRLGRHWVSEPGNLYVTFVFTLDGSALVAARSASSPPWPSVTPRSPLLPRRVAPVKLKWPNDVLLDGAKFAGILPETVAQSGDGRVTVALGCGLNVAHAPKGTPYPVTALAHHGGDITPRDCLDCARPLLSHWLGVWDKGRGFADDPAKLACSRGGSRPGFRAVW